MIQIVRLSEDLPDGFQALSDDAAAEGVRNMRLLADRWIGGERYDGEGEGLYAAYVDGDLAAVGGVARCPDVEGAMRMRRFYVRPGFRRSGVARTLAAAAMQQGMQNAAELTCNARASAAAPLFWEAMGFIPDTRPGITHSFRA